MNHRPDYGSKGCCGPAAFAMLAVIVGGLTALGWWLA